ncbi:hypothetical protein [Nocardia vaccinii]|uniref:hypothetical protein n=1 Tax=Nocardia vaccinii TaxID=1822 RepID=UPI0008362EAB|nr:hypothetical protein [Nocardia vaccinii]
MPHTNLLANLAIPNYCPDCGYKGGRHGLVHVRNGNGGGHNEPCPRDGSTPFECPQCPGLERGEMQALAEIERLEELLDEMTAALGAAMMRDFGEHSSANDPWANALRALKGLEA